ncbi:ABC transporter substrate-binding protein [Geminicoccus flavidas]|uniref:ABC transporter substrate-binding protein n=1 Tax=Geminicoccus flavidas TaxID=2506407 RepID=UPI0013575E6D|nr:ABC transporter substrate-binding protein [Geminicoccus flavidas]
MKRRTLLAGTALGATALGAMRLGTPALAAEEVTLDVFYTQPSFSQFHEPIAAEFMKQRPDIKIVYRAPAANYDEGHQVMLRAAVTNQLPDVYYAGYHLLAELIHTLERRNQVLDLGPLLEAEPAEWREANYAPAILSLGQVDGVQRGLGVAASSCVMYVNEDLVRAAGGDPDNMPTTLDEIITLAAKIKEATSGVAGLTYNVHDWPDDWLWQTLIFQEGGELYGPATGKVAYNNELGLHVLEDARRFVTEGGMKLINFDESRQQFVAGQTGIQFDTPARVRQVTELIGDKFKMRTVAFPVSNKEKGKLPTGGNAAIIAASDEAKQKAAWEFIKFVTGPQAQKIVVETTGYMPTNKLATGPDYLGPFYDANPNFATVTSQIDRSRPWQGYPGGNSVRIWRTQRDIIANVMRGDVTPEDGLAQIVEQTEALMK